MDNNVIVICTNCGVMVPWDPSDLNHPFGVHHWHAPYPRCGAEAWSIPMILIETGELEG